MRRLYFALDFDGTCCTHAFPEIGELKEEHLALHEFIREMHRLGHCIMLNTCREDIPGERNYLTEAVEACKTFDVPIDYVNENPENPYIGKGVKPRKIMADYYIDDRAININYFKENTYEDFKIKI